MWGVRKKRSGRQGGGGARAHCKVGGAKDQPTNGGAAGARRLNPAKLKRIARAAADVSMTQARPGSLRTSTGRRRAGCVRCIPANTRPGYRPSSATRTVCRSVRGGCASAPPYALSMARVDAVCELVLGGRRSSVVGQQQKSATCFLFTCHMKKIEDIKIYTYT